jgi:hypothetical protein
VFLFLLVFPLLLFDLCSSYTYRHENGCSEALEEIVNSKDEGNPSALDVLKISTFLILGNGVEVCVCVCVCVCVLVCLCDFLILQTSKFIFIYLFWILL